MAFVCGFQDGVTALHMLMVWKVGQMHWKWSALVLLAVGKQDDLS